MRTGLGRARRRVAATALTVVVGVVLAGCSEGGDGPDGPDGQGGGPGGEDTQSLSVLGKVRGNLDDAQAEQVLAEVTEVVDAWIDAAYAGDYPRTDFADAYASFTPGARSRAEAQAAVMSNAEVGGDVDGARVIDRSVTVDVLGAKGKPAGATARIEVSVELTGGVERTDQVTGRLMLTPGNDGWQVFGFDVSRGEGGA